MIAKKLFSGASYQTISWLTTIIVSFFMTPFVISNLGKDSYGLWLLAASIFSFYGVLDLGLSVATQRAINQALAKNDISAANETVITSFAVFCGIGTLTAAVTLIIFFSGNLILSDQSLISDFRWVVALLGLSIALMFPTYAVSGIYTANFRIDISSRIHLVKFLLRTLLIYLALRVGYGVIVMALVTALTDIAAAIITLFIASKLAPWLSWKLNFFRRERLREMFSFGSAFLFVSICERGRGALPSFAMNSGFGLSGVTYFGVPQQLYDYFTRLIGNIIAVFQPLFIQQQSIEKHHANSVDFIFVTEISFFISIILASGILICAPEFFDVWLGPQFEQSLPPLYILIVSGVFSMGSQPAQQLMFAYSQQKELALISAFEVVLTALIIFPAAHYSGLLGVALAVSMPTVISRLIVQPLIARRALSFDGKNYCLLILKAGLLLFAIYKVSPSISSIATGKGYLKVAVLGCYAIAVALPTSALLLLSGPTRKRLFTFFYNSLGSSR